MTLKLNRIGYSQLLNWMLKHAIMDYNIPLEHIFFFRVVFQRVFRLKI